MGVRGRNHHRPLLEPHPCARKPGSTSGPCGEGPDSQVSVVGRLRHGDLMEGGAAIKGVGATSRSVMQEGAVLARPSPLQTERWDLGQRGHERIMPRPRHAPWPMLPRRSPPGARTVVKAEQAPQELCVCFPGVTQPLLRASK